MCTTRISTAIAYVVLVAIPLVLALHDSDDADQGAHGVGFAPTPASFCCYRPRILIILTPRTLPALSTLPTTTTARPAVPAPVPVLPAPVPSVVPPAPVPTLPPVG